MSLYIKNMVCLRCISAVEQELERLEIRNAKVHLGEVETEEEIDGEKIQILRKNLAAMGFELLDDSRKKLIEKIKNLIIQRIHHAQEKDRLKISEVISNALHKDYSYLSNLFSDVEGITIEKYIIHQKIEKVKELITYDELSLSEIAFLLDYSSVAHLSNQFKKVTGLTPSHFKKIGINKRKPLDKV